MQTLDISIIIANYKTPELLRLCLKSIQRLNLKDKNLIKEIIVSDGETDDYLLDLMEEEFPCAQVIPHKINVGYSKLVNSGIKKSQGKYCLIINTDIIITPGSIIKLAEFLEKNNQIGILGPRLINLNGTFQDTAFRFYTLLTILYRRTILGYLPFAKKQLAKFLMADIDRENPYEADWLMGAALMVRKDALLKVGLMDENIFLYFEDVDWCKRFWENNYKVMCFPKARMFHYHNRASKRWGGLRDLFNPLTLIHIKSAFYFFKKHGFKDKSLSGKSNLSKN